MTKQALMKQAAGWRKRLDALWLEACWWDDLPEETAFAVFSEGNPAAAQLNQVMGEYLDWAREVTGR